jgi:hypothetical protein
MLATNSLKNKKQKKKNKIQVHGQNTTFLISNNVTNNYNQIPVSNKRKNIPLPT